MTVVIAMDIFPRRRVASRKDISIGAAYCTLSLGICTSFKSAAQEAEQYRNNITRPRLIHQPLCIESVLLFALQFLFFSFFLHSRSFSSSI